MHRRSHVLALLLASLLVLAGCAKPADNASTATASTMTGDPPASGAPGPHPRACELVTATEMSKILGTTVLGSADESASGKTECLYAPGEGAGPQVEFAVTWGDGHAAMTAMGMMGDIEPGIADPYAGLGDQAAAVGPVLMIRTGEDLITLTFSGVDDAPGVAREVFDTAKARL